MSMALDHISDYIDTAKTVSAGSDLEKTLGRNLSSSSDEELMEACKEFETYFMEQVLKGMEKTIPKDDEDSSVSQMTDFYKDMAREELAAQMAEQTGNSLAQTMYEQMKRNYSL